MPEASDPSGRLRIVPPEHALPPWAADRRHPVPAGHTEDAYRALLVAAERDGAARPGLADTPARAARAWQELTAGYTIDVPALMTTFDGEGHDDLVVVRDVPFYSLCEHHLLPFHGTASLAYIPNARIVGLSKVARVVDAYARRLQVQERITTQLADAFASPPLNAAGVLATVEAEHLCMSMRGVQRPGHRTITSAVRGILRDNPPARAEALALLGRTA